CGVAGVFIRQSEFDKVVGRHEVPHTRSRYPGTKPETVNQKSATSTKPEDNSLRRLLLCEVLLEEYESLGQPALGSEVSDIKKEIDEYHAREKASDSEPDEEEVNGKFVKDIYRLM